MVSYHSGLTVVSHHWSLITVVSYHSGLSSQWFLITVVTHPSGLSSQWSLVTVVSHPGGLSSQWSVVTVIFLQVVSHHNIQSSTLHISFDPLAFYKTHLFSTGDHQWSNSGQPDGGSEEDEQHHRIQRPPLQCEPMHEWRCLHPHPEQRWVSVSLQLHGATLWKA